MSAIEYVKTPVVVPPVAAADPWLAVTVTGPPDVPADVTKAPLAPTNVPLVSASMGMFSMGTDDPVWHLIAYSAGTGGSMLIIGSAAGVVAMGMEKIDFFWYLKKIAWLAFVGFIGGFITFVLIRNFVI